MMMWTNLWILQQEVEADRGGANHRDKLVNKPNLKAIWSKFKKENIYLISEYGVKLAEYIFRETLIVE